LKFRSLFYTSAGAPRAPLRAAGFLAAAIVVSGVLSILLAPFGASLDGGLRTDLLTTVIGVVGALCASWIALRHVDRKPWSEIGLGRSAAKAGPVIAGFSIGAFAIAIPILLLIALGWLRYRPVIITPPGHPLVALTMVLIPAALNEELLTRGYLLTLIRDAWGWPAAVVITSIGFGLLHLANPGATLQSVTIVTLAGVFLAIVRIATGSLYAAWAAHFAWNWVMAVVFHAAVSGLTFDVPGYRYVDAGPDWATGGVWGPEGGIPAGLAMIAGGGLLVARLRRRGRGESIDG
jgi:uncharacterized protein